MSFSQIIGQERAEALATAWLSAGRLPHAILVCGPAGTGKRRFARELAKAILCQQGKGLACDQCVSCHKVEELLHPDLHVLVPLPPNRGGKSASQGLEEMRNAAVDYLQQGEAPFHSSANIARDQLRSLQREMSYAPAEGQRRVGLIYEAECMHPAGANSLLKMLEEPSRNAIFILVSSAPERLLPTVLSRCQRLPLQRLSPGVLRAHFSDSGLEPERVELAVRLAGGSLQRAEQVACGELDELRGLVEAFLAAGAGGDDAGYWSLLDELGVRDERGRLERFLELCGVYLRDLFLLAHGLTERMALVDRCAALERLLGCFSLDQLEAAAIEVDRAFDYLTRNVNVHLVLADLWRCLRSSRRQEAVAQERSSAPS